MRVFTDNGNISNADLIFTFDSPIFAFGADFRSINDQINRTQILVGPDTLALPIPGASGEFSFFGFTSPTPFTTVTFDALANDVYGIDNVTYGVPAPGILALLGIGLAGIGFSRRSRR